MWRQLLGAAGTGALILGGTPAVAADLDYPSDAAYEENGGYRHNGDYRDNGDYRRPVHRTNGVDHAYRKLEKHGFYEITVERASAPYSFNACKRGKRYHVHIGYDGELEELNSLGACHQYAYDGYDERPRYYSRYHENWRNRVYRRARYDHY